jgi:hypothetical protein
LSCCQRNRVEVVFALGIVSKDNDTLVVIVYVVMFVHEEPLLVEKLSKTPSPGSMLSHVPPMETKNVKLVRGCDASTGRVMATRLNESPLNKIVDREKQEELTNPPTIDPQFELPKLPPWSGSEIFTIIGGT